MNQHITDLVDSSEASKHCAGKICHLTYYSGMVLNEDLWNDERENSSIKFNFLAFMVKSSSMYEVIFEEYLIYDFIEMVGTLGGSLGLLLGFSFFACLCTALDYLYQQIRKRF